MTREEAIEVLKRMLRQNSLIATEVDAIDFALRQIDLVPELVEACQAALDDDDKTKMVAFGGSLGLGVPTIEKLRNAVAKAVEQ